MAARTMNTVHSTRHRRENTSRPHTDTAHLAHRQHEVLGAPDAFPSAQHYHEISPRDTYHLAQHNHVEIPAIQQHALRAPLVQPGAWDTFDLAQQYHETPVISQQAFKYETPLIPGPSPDAFHFAPHYHNDAPQTPLIQPGHTFRSTQHHPEAPLIPQQAVKYETPLIPGPFSDGFHFAQHYQNDAPPIRQHDAPQGSLIQPGDTFRLAQHHRETPLIQPQGLYTHGPFSNAHDFVMLNPVFNDMGIYKNYSDEPGNDIRAFFSRTRLC